MRQSILGQMVTAGPCPTCGGHGRGDRRRPCADCRGEGRRTEERTYTVDVPAGVDDGSTLRLTGRGAAGPRGGPPGDLYVHLRVRPHERFQRQGYDLVHELHVPMTQAALGAHIPFETLDGTEDLVIPAGTQSGRVFRLRGRGVPHVNARGRGELLVQVVVDTPTELDERAGGAAAPAGRAAGRGGGAARHRPVLQDPQRLQVSGSASSGRRPATHVFVRTLEQLELADDDHHHLARVLRSRRRAGHRGRRCGGGGRSWLPPAAARSSRTATSVDERAAGAGHHRRLRAHQGRAAGVGRAEAHRGRASTASCRSRPPGRWCAGTRQGGPTPRRPPGWWRGGGHAEPAGVAARGRAGGVVRARRGGPRPGGRRRAGAARRARPARRCSSGPRVGWTEEELAAAGSAHRWAGRPTVLRAETAAMAGGDPALRPAGGTGRKRWVVDRRGRSNQCPSIIGWTNRGVSRSTTTVGQRHDRRDRRGHDVIRRGHRPHLRRQGRRAPAGHPQAEGPVAAGGRGRVRPGVQGVGARRLRAGRAGHLGAPAAAPGPLLQRAGRPAPARRRRPRLRRRPATIDLGRRPSPAGPSPRRSHHRPDPPRDPRRGPRRAARPLPRHDPGAAPGLQRPGAHHPPRRPAGHRLPLRRPSPTAPRRPPASTISASATRPLARRPARRVPCPSASTCTSRSARAVRLLRVRDVDRPAPPDRARTSTACAPEIARRRPAAGGHDVFFGGGTPSLLPAELLVSILDAVPLAPGAEVTVECNPDTVTPALFDAYRAAGVTRLSRSACSRWCRTCWRPWAAPTTVDHVRTAVALAADAGFESFNVDLIYGGAGSRWRTGRPRSTRSSPSTRPRT